MEIIVGIEQRLSIKKLLSLKGKVSAILGKVPNNVDIPEWDKLPISEDASSVEKMRAFKKRKLASSETITEMRDKGR